MTNPFNDPVDYSDGEEGLDYEDLIQDSPGSSYLVGSGTCRDEFEEREADLAMSRYEKGMGW